MTATRIGETVAYHGDCIETMDTLIALGTQVDSIVTDPPYHLTGGGTGARGFMGKEWDGGDIAFNHETWRRCYDLIKPGGYLLAFSGSRTYHRMACAIEDAGFEIRDQLMWLYGTGFPKSHDVSKAIDKAAGAEHLRQVIAPRPGVTKTFNVGATEVVKPRDPITAPATDAAREWDGWGTALKPAHEPVVMARKPLIGTVAANVLEHGTGAINIDACRVPGEKPDTTRGGNTSQTSYALGAQGRIVDDGKGRFPTNIIHDGSDEVTAMLGDAARFFKECPFDASLPREVCYTDATENGDASWQDQNHHQSNADIAGQSLSLRNVLANIVQSVAVTWPSLAGIVSSDSPGRSMNVIASEYETICATVTTTMTNIGSGFSQESQHEKHTLCGNLVSCAATRNQTGTTTITTNLSKSDGSVESVTFIITPMNTDLGEAVSRFKYTAKASRKDRAGSKHPTVKPVSLIEYLCKLVTRPGGTVLDPFAGSGTLGSAWPRSILIEREAEYYADILRRLQP